MEKYLVAALVMSLLSACENERPAPPLVAPPPMVAKAESPPDAGPAEAAPDETESEEPLGLQDDAQPLEVSSLDGEPLKALLVRDPNRAAQSLAELATPDAWQVAILAQLARRLGEPGPDAVPEPKMPEVLPLSDGLDEASDAGVTSAFVGSALLPLRASANPKAPVVLQLPINTPVQVSHFEGKLAAVTVEIATDVSFGASGSTPINVVNMSRNGFVEARFLVTQKVGARPLAALAATKKLGDEQQEDEAVVLRHRAFLIERNESSRRALIDAAWAAHRASWVVSAALSQLHVAPKRIDVAWACLGDRRRAKWLSVASGKLPTVLPASYCLTRVDLRKPCSLKRHEAWQQRREAFERAGLAQQTVVQLSVDATKPRSLWFYTAALRAHETCGGTTQFDVDANQTTVRTLFMPLGTAKTTVRIESDAYDGVEFGVVAAANEERARGWLRRRGKSRFTLDAHTGELVLSLGVHDTGFEGDREVTGVTSARAPASDCECGDEE